ncbi:hypothetical protein KM043_016774 [Ampulex compressa]|nr:hypothetical protein KM043_016774 [Ampulex compressa]
MSMSPENITIKQPIRRLEIQISNFNVAIPHHVNLLKRHKTNIKKYENQHDWEKVHKEHINVSRIIRQLKELLYQMDTLRAQVLDTDINQFDKLTANARSNIMNAIKEYLELQLNLPISEPISPMTEDQSPKHPLDDRDIQLKQEQEEFQRQQTCLYAWNSLQDDIHQLHDLFIDFNKFVLEQKELVNNAEDNIEETHENVQEGAVLGTCIGGPIGLLAGMKIGGLTAIGCGILGFTGGSFLKKKGIETHSENKDKEISLQQDNVKKSVSLPDNLKDHKKEL